MLQSLIPSRDVLNVEHQLDAKGASFRVREPEVTTMGVLGRIVIKVLGMVADMELSSFGTASALGHGGEGQGARRNGKSASMTPRAESSPRRADPKPTSPAT